MYRHRMPDREARLSPHLSAKTPEDVIDLLASWTVEDQRKIAKALLTRCKHIKRVVEIPDGWNDLYNIPIGVPVEIISVRGIRCTAIARKAGRAGVGAGWIKRADKYGHKRIACYRVDGKTRGDIWAIAWRKK